MRHIPMSFQRFFILKLSLTQLTLHMTHRIRSIMSFHVSIEMNRLGEEFQTQMALNERSIVNFTSMEEQHFRAREVLLAHLTVCRHDCLRDFSLHWVFSIRFSVLKHSGVFSKFQITSILNLQKKCKCFIEICQISEKKHKISRFFQEITFSVILLPDFHQICATIRFFRLFYCFLYRKWLILKIIFFGILNFSKKLNEKAKSLFFTKK